MTIQSECPVVAVLGAQWGDEGKGKLVDIFSQNTKCCARFNGGANAGHTIKVGEQQIAFHLLPSGILNANCMNLIGAGVVLHLQTLAREIDEIQKQLGQTILNRLKISSRTHITFDYHIAADCAEESLKEGKGQAIGTTRRGIGPSYAAKALRISLRGSDIVGSWEKFEEKYLFQFEFFRRAFQLEQFDPSAELRTLRPLISRFAPLVVDSTSLLHSLTTLEKVSDGKSLEANEKLPLLEKQWNLVIEGANAALLDSTWGSYPYCSSSHTTAAGAGVGLGIPPRRITHVIGVAKAYCTRVGEGPFPTELLDNLGEYLRKKGVEYGASTGRPRRCGWFDVPLMLYSDALNGYDYLMITKLDVFSGLKEIKIGTAYLRPDGSKLTPRSFPADLNELAEYQVEYKVVPGWQEDISQVKAFEGLPLTAQQYIETIERLLGLPVVFIGVGPDRKDILFRKSLLATANILH